MCAGGGLGRVAVAAAQCLQDGPVLRMRGLGPAAERQQGGQQRDGGGKLLQAAQQVAVVRREVEQPVQALVDAGQPCRIAEQGRIGLHQLGHGLDLRVGSRAGGEPRGRALQKLAHHVQLDHLGVVGLRDGQAPGGSCVQQPLGLQPRDRLRTGVAGAAEARRQVGLGQPDAGRQRAVADRGADAL
jgi:hypothetical protein